MADIQYWDDTLVEEIESIRQLLNQIPSMSAGAEKSNMLERVEKKLRAAQGTKRSFTMEIRLVQDPNMRRNFEQRQKQLDKQLINISADQKALKQEYERGELLKRQEEGGITEEDGQKAGDSMLNDAMRIQDKTGDSLGNTANMIKQSKEVGMATLEELARQRDVLGNIDKEIDRVDDNLARSEKLIKQFGKRMGTDKVIRCFAMINFLLLGGVIIWVVFFKKDGPISSDGGTPINPFGDAGDANARRFLLRH